MLVFILIELPNLGTCELLKIDSSRIDKLIFCSFRFSSIGAKSSGCSPINFVRLIERDLRANNPDMPIFDKTPSVLIIPTYSSMYEVSINNSLISRCPGISIPS